VNASAPLLERVAVGEHRADVDAAAADESKMLDLVLALAVDDSIATRSSRRVEPLEVPGDHSNRPAACNATDARWFPGV